MKRSEKARKILFLTPDMAGRGGVAHYCKTIGLDGDSDKEYFVVNRAADQMQIVVIVKLMCKYIRFVWRLIVGEIDLVHANPSFTRRSFLRDGVFIGLSRLFGKEVIVLFHGWDEIFSARVTTSRILMAFFRQTYGRCNNFMVLGKVFKAKLGELGLKDARIWIETTMAESYPHDDLEIPKKLLAWRRQPTIVFMSRVLRNKGIFTALDAYYYLIAKNPDCNARFIVAGDGEDLEEAKKYATSKNTGEIAFVGYVSGKEKEEILSQGHVFLFPTVYGEGMPIAILEAMAFGMAIVSRPVGAISDVVRDGVNGFLSNEVDPKVFGELISKLMCDTQLFSDMVRVNHRHALENFVPGVIKKRIRQIYEEI